MGCSRDASETTGVRRRGDRVVVVFSVLMVKDHGELLPLFFQRLESKPVTAQSGFRGTWVVSVGRTWGVNRALDRGVEYSFTGPHAQKGAPTWL